ncbi:MAG: DUF3303 family protein [Dehalococcoidales bacterium]|jgi:hypothetical protein
MLFQIVHTHTAETCPGKSPEVAKRTSEWWQNLKKTPGVKVLAGNASTLEHTFYITVETDDYATLARALGPLLSIGTGHISPVLTIDQTLPMAEAGVFRAHS